MLSKSIGLACSTIAPVSRSSTWAGDTNGGVPRAGVRGDARVRCEAAIRGRAVVIISGCTGARRRTERMFGLGVRAASGAAIVAFLLTRLCTRAIVRRALCVTRRQIRGNPVVSTRSWRCT